MWCNLSRRKWYKCCVTWYVMQSDTMSEKEKTASGFSYSFRQVSKQMFHPSTILHKCACHNDAMSFLSFLLYKLRQEDIPLSPSAATKINPIFKRWQSNFSLKNNYMNVTFCKLKRGKKEINVQSNGVYNIYRKSLTIPFCFGNLQKIFLFFKVGILTQNVHFHASFKSFNDDLYRLLCECAVKWVSCLKWMSVPNNT